MLDANGLLTLTSIISNIATFLGIPLAIFVFWRDRYQAREAKEQETYQLLQSGYSDYLKFCFDNLDLQLHDYHPQVQISFTPEQEKRRMIAFEIMVSMFESAYFYYNRNHSSKFKKRQWTGWEQYIRQWVARDDFKKAWQEHLGYQFDSEFIAYVNDLMGITNKSI